MLVFRPLETSLDKIRYVQTARRGDIQTVSSRSPPGPGCRSSLFRMRCRWQRQGRDGGSRVRALYTSCYSVTGVGYTEELADFHAQFIKRHRKKLSTLLSLFQKPRQWVLRDTQAALCAFARYMHVRQALLGAKGSTPAVRMYDRAPAWPH